MDFYWSVIQAMTWTFSSLFRCLVILRYSSNDLNYRLFVQYHGLNNRPSNTCPWSEYHSSLLFKSPLHVCIRKLFFVYFQFYVWQCKFCNTSCHYNLLLLKVHSAKLKTTQKKTILCWGDVMHLVNNNKIILINSFWNSKKDSRSLRFKTW